MAAGSILEVANFLVYWKSGRSGHYVGSLHQLNCPSFSLHPISLVLNELTLGPPEHPTKTWLLPSMRTAKCNGHGILRRGKIFRSIKSEKEIPPSLCKLEACAVCCYTELHIQQLHTSPHLARQFSSKAV